MFEDYLPEYHQEYMDKKIKKIQRQTKTLEKEEAELLRMDKKHDKIIDRAKKKLKK